MSKVILAAGWASPYFSRVSWERPASTTWVAVRLLRAVTMSLKAVVPDSAVTGSVTR